MTYPMFCSSRAMQCTVWASGRHSALDISFVHSFSSKASSLYWFGILSSATSSRPCSLGCCQKIAVTLKYSERSLVCYLPKRPAYRQDGRSDRSILSSPCFFEPSQDLGGAGHPACTLHVPVNNHGRCKQNTELGNLLLVLPIFSICTGRPCSLAIIRTILAASRHFVHPGPRILMSISMIFLLVSRFVCQFRV